MLEGNRIAPNPGTGKPGPDGFVDVPANLYDRDSITFPNPPTELSTIRVKPPANSLLGDLYTVIAIYTDEDGNRQNKVLSQEFILLQILT